MYSLSMRREAIRVQGRRRPAVKAKSNCSCRNSSAISSDAAVLPWTTSVSSDWRPRTAGFRWAKRTSAPLLLVRRCVAWRPVVPRPLHRHPGLLKVRWAACASRERRSQRQGPVAAPWRGETMAWSSWSERGPHAIHNAYRHRRPTSVSGDAGRVYQDRPAPNKGLRYPVSASTTLTSRAISQAITSAGVPRPAPSFVDRSWGGVRSSTPGAGWSSGQVDGS